MENKSLVNKAQYERNNRPWLRLSFKHSGGIKTVEIPEKIGSHQVSLVDPYDKQSGNGTMLENEILDSKLSKNAKMLYWALRRNICFGTDFTFANEDILKKQAGLNKDNISKHLKELRDHKVIDYEAISYNTARNNYYIFLPKSQWRLELLTNKSKVKQEEVALEEVATTIEEISSNNEPVESKGEEDLKEQEFFNWLYSKCFLPKYKGKLWIDILRIDSGYIKWFSETCKDTKIQEYCLKALKLPSAEFLVDDQGKTHRQYAREGNLEKLKQSVEKFLKIEINGPLTLNALQEELDLLNSLLGTNYEFSEDQLKYKQIEIPEYQEYSLEEVLALPEPKKQYEEDSEENIHDDDDVPF